MKKYLEIFTPMRMIIFVILVLNGLLYLDSTVWSQSNIVSNNNIKGTYVIKPESSKRKFVNLDIGVSKNFIKVNSISSSKKELTMFNLPIFSIFSKVNATSVSEVKVKGLYGDNYYVNNIRYIPNVDGSLNSVVELSYLKESTLETLGLKSEKDITLPYYYTLELGSKVSVNGDVITPNNDIKDKSISYKVPKDTIFKFNFKSQSDIVFYYLILCFISLWVLVLIIIADIQELCDEEYGKYEKY